MTMYRAPREAFGGGVDSWVGIGVGTPASRPNNTVNKPVSPASMASPPCCPGSPSPETTIAWTSPGPLMRAWEGPFAAAGVASVIAAAMLMPAARAVTTISLRISGGSLCCASLLLHRTPMAGSSRTSAGSVRRVGDGERGCLAEVAFQAERYLTGAPDQGVASGEAGRGDGQSAVGSDVHQFMGALDPQGLGAVHFDPGHVAHMNELLEEDLVDVTGVLV